MTANVNIEVLNAGALGLLSEMERLDLIRLNVPLGSAAVEAGSGKLSEQFAGALRLSEVEHEAFQSALREGRDEWSRDIFYGSAG